MSQSVLSDAGVGRAIFTTRMGLSIKALKMCIEFGFLPAFLLIMGYWYFNASNMEISLVKIDLVSKYADESAYSKWRVTNNQGERLLITTTDENGNQINRFKPYQIKAVLAKEWAPVNRFYVFVYMALVAGLVAHFLVWLILKRVGEKNQENQRVAGAEYVITGDELGKLVRGKNEAGPYKLVGVPLPKYAPMTGLLCMGAQGSGKSVAIHDLMQQVFARKRKSIIYDQSGEFFRAHFRPGKDFFFNPSMFGSVPWSLPSELFYSYDADTLGRAFLPPRNEGTGGPSAFFEDAARALFSVILLRLRERGAVYTSDIATAFLEMPDEDMMHLIKNSVASSAIGGDSKAQRQGVISSIAIFLNGISAVQKGTWTIRDFIAAEDDARLFILSSEDTRAMFAPLYRLMLSVAFSAIESKQEIVHEDKFWFFLDEIQQLGDIRVDEKLAVLRKFGVCIVSGIQSDKQFMAALGDDRGEVVMNMYNTVLMLRANDDKLQERIARRLGKMEETVINRNAQLAVTEWRDGGGINQVDREKFVVLPSDVGSLDVCEGFLKFVGSYPAAKVNFKHWLPKKKGAKSYVDKWKEKNKNPERDPNFIIQVRSKGDVFRSLREEVENDKLNVGSDVVTTEDGKQVDTATGEVFEINFFEKR